MLYPSLGEEPGHRAGLRGVGTPGGAPTPDGVPGQGYLARALSRPPLRRPPQVPWLLYVGLTWPRSHWYGVPSPRPARGPRRARLAGAGGRRQRSLLALLLLHANEALSTERLIDELWGESPRDRRQERPGLRLPTAQAAREADEARPACVTREPGYVLRVDPSRGLAPLRAARRRGRARSSGGDARDARRREALALWRGPPLADLAYEPFAQGEIARLEELRLRRSSSGSRPSWRSAATPSSSASWRR